MFDRFPVDRILAAYAGADVKEPGTHIAGATGLVASTEAQVTTIYGEVVKALADDLAALKEKFPESADAKAVFYAGRYPAKDAIRQLDETLTYLKTKSGLHKEEAAAAGGEPPAADPPAADVEMEGGDGAEEGAAAVDPGAAGAAEAMAPLENPNKYEGIDDHEGWANFGAALLRNAIVNPVFGDLLRSNALSAEFNPSGYKNNGYTGAAALVSALSAAHETAEKEFWLSGYVTQEYLESLNDIVEGKTAIHFPFVSVGWNTEADAKAALQFPAPEKADNYTPVIFHVTKGATFDFAKVRVVAHRLNGTVTAAEAQDKIRVFNVEATSLAAQTVEAWNAAKDAKDVVTPPAAAADPPAADPPAADPPAAAE